MPRMAADQFADTLVAAGVKHDCGIVGDRLNGLGDAIRRQGKIKWPHVWHQQIVGLAAAAILASAAGLLAAAIGARAADGPARLKPPAERAGTDSGHGQAAARQFAPPIQPNVGAGASFGI
jgi:hypothetical protein